MASPEMIQLLKQKGIGFATNRPIASSTKRTTTSTTLVKLARTSLILFYCTILWRFYRTLSNATGGGKNNNNNDTPGKLFTNQKKKKKKKKKKSRLFFSFFGKQQQHQNNNNNDLSDDDDNDIITTFDDIQGMDDVKLEVMELVDTLRYPDKYSILGARAPTGLLLEGPPGTGKTMLARATAASVGLPLLSCSGSDFVEMFVGRGAARVRKLFDRATKLAPCIIFIDELDALGKSRDMSLGGAGGPFGGGSFRSNDEAEQTLNQLLACMDGLDSTRRICVLAATNRKEVLDPALLRPGRLDRIVKLKLPDAVGREKILRVHCQKLPGFQERPMVKVGDDDDATAAARRKKKGQLLSPSTIASWSPFGQGEYVDLSAIAAVTEGLSGAELEFIVNEAAIRAVRRVSAQLRNSSSLSNSTMTTMESRRQQEQQQQEPIVPHVQAKDFEASVQNFFQTRRKGNAGWFGSF